MRITWLGILAVGCCLLATSCDRVSNANSSGQKQPATIGNVEWTTPDAEVVEALRTAHVAVRDRLAAEQWAEAAALISDAGVQRVDQMRKLALYGDSEALGQLSLMDLLYVLVMRKLNEPEQLRDIPPREFVAWTMENKMLGPHWRDGDKLEELEILGENRARGKRVYENGHPSNLQVFFDRESDGWRVSLDGEFLKQEEDFKLLASAPTAETPSQLITTIYEVRTMSKLTPEIFVPPFQDSEN